MNRSWIKILAVAPPEFERDFLEQWKRMSSVNSATPYALLATLERTFHRVQEGTLNVLNWKDPESIRESVFLMHHWMDERDMFIQKIEKIKPNIVLLGTFAMNFPGAIELAKTIRSISPETLIVLGGRHIGETFWSDMNGYTFGAIHEHAEANPLSLMESGEIPHIFDLVVSHDGQELIPKIIETVEEMQNSGKTSREVMNDIWIFQNVPGYWTLGTINKEGTVEYTRPQSYTPIHTPENRSPYVYAGSDRVKFPVFELTDWTAHVHSDSQGIPWNTCTMDCSFCSEARGKMPLKKSHETESADRLFSRFCDIVSVAKNDFRVPSIFVEDSILCGGHWWAMERFCELMESAKESKKELPLEWWCQFTVPMIMNPRGQKIISRLQNVGLTYIYFWLESAKPEIAQTIAKTWGREWWSSLSERAVKYLSEAGIKVGTSNIFCMGEEHADRMSQLRLIKSWQEKYSGNPVVYSLNLQTVHPGEWNPTYTGQRPSYTHWWLESSDPRSPLLQELFWEATVKYLRNLETLPTLEQLKEIRYFLNTMNNKTIESRYFCHALGTRKRQITPEIVSIMKKSANEIASTAENVARRLLFVQWKGKVYFTAGVTFWLAEILRGIFWNKAIKIVFSDHELRHVQKAIGKWIISTHDTTWASFWPPKTTLQHPW